MKMTHLDCVGDKCSGIKQKKKSERMRAARMFLNEGEKENKKEWGIEIVKHVWRRKIRKKKKKKRNEMYG